MPAECHCRQPLARAPGSAAVHTMCIVTACNPLPLQGCRAAEECTCRACRLALCSLDSALYRALYGALPLAVERPVHACVLGCLELTVPHAWALRVVLPVPHAWAEHFADAVTCLGSELCFYMRRRADPRGPAGAGGVLRRQAQGGHRAGARLRLRRLRLQVRHAGGRGTAPGAQGARPAEFHIKAFAPVPLQCTVCNWQPISTHWRWVERSQSLPKHIRPLAGVALICLCYVRAQCWRHPCGVAHMLSERSWQTSQCHACGSIVQRAWQFGVHARALGRSVP